MPRERRANGNKRGKRQRHIQNNDETQSRSKKNVKSSGITRTNRFSPFIRAERHSRRGMTMDDNMAFSKARHLHAKSKEIIERGMEYILFHLQLIQMSIWGSNHVNDNKTLKETEQATEAVDAINSETHLFFEKEKCLEDSYEGGMFTAAEDSDDSSSDHWSTANDFVNMNMSIDLETEYEEIRINNRIVIEEPMDISMEESSPRKRVELVSSCKSGSQEASRCSRDTTSHDSGEDDDKSLGDSESDSDSVELSSALDEEITKILKRRGSSDNDNYSFFSEEEHGRRNFPYFRDYASSESTSVSGTDSLSDRREVRNTQRDASAKRRIVPCCCCLSPRKREEHRRSIVKNYINYEITNDQVDSAFSEDDVEMSALERSVLEAHLNGKLSNRRNGKDMEIMDQDTTLQGEALSFFDRNPTSIKKFWTDVNREDYDNSSISTNRYSERFNNFSSNVLPTLYVKGPPGFPNLPQNLPPVSCSCGNPECFILLGNEIGQSKMIYPNAPRPLRHLYYQYPEFMEPLTPYHNSPSW